jgi:hypothetical protein
MKECDKRNGHTSRDLHFIDISSNNGRHSVTKTFTTLHPTTLHSTSLHLSTLRFFPFKLYPSTLHSTSLYFSHLHFTTRPFALTPFQFPTAPFPFTLWTKCITNSNSTSVRYVMSIFLGLRHCRRVCRTRDNLILVAERLIWLLALQQKLKMVAPPRPHDGWHNDHVLILFVCRHASIHLWWPT